jgi:hypothetical protein
MLLTTFLIWNLTWGATFSSIISPLPVQFSQQNVEEVFLIQLLFYQPIEEALEMPFHISEFP